jgi:hypothetical protein
MTGHGVVGGHRLTRRGLAMGWVPPAKRMRLMATPDGNPLKRQVL